MAEDALQFLRRLAARASDPHYRDTEVPAEVRESLDKVLVIVGIKPRLIPKDHIAFNLIRTLMHHDDQGRARPLTYGQAVLHIEHLIDALESQWERKGWHSLRIPPTRQQITLPIDGRNRKQHRPMPQDPPNSEPLPT